MYEGLVVAHYTLSVYAKFMKADSFDSLCGTKWSSPQLAARLQYSEEGTGWGCSLPRPQAPLRCTKCNSPRMQWPAYTSHRIAVLWSVALGYFAARCYASAVRPSVRLPRS